MTLPTDKPECCDVLAHKWREEYYGHRCAVCGLFYAFGCAPWDEPDEYPDDYYGSRDPEECWHENAEIDVVDGVGRCYECGHAWMASTAEIEAETRFLSEYEEQMSGGENILMEMIWRVRQAIHTFFFRRKHKIVSDDDIPF